MASDPKNFDPEIIKRLVKLEDKYNAMGQDLSSYLDGLLHADYLTYWDYVNLDTLLSLQQPKTPFKDETIFITYHQITELYFKLILWEISQMTGEKKLSAELFLEKLKRINNYFDQLTNSFGIMVEGLDKRQFLSFRMSLLPSSGFQSAQYRFIEIAGTDAINLVSIKHREKLTNEQDTKVLYDAIYWKEGASELATGKKTLTLKQFEEKYSEELIKRMRFHTNNNLNSIFHANYANGDEPDEIIKELRKLDVSANINWPLSHYRSAAKHLQNDPDVIAATGGTNWQKYLPPRFQKVCFFPKLWSAEEMEDWGKSWVNEVLNS
ncbi:MAG: tryptophan 2,3-dioxygenase family protein [Cyclobacteriaceae bacterium]